MYLKLFIFVSSVFVDERVILFHSEILEIDCISNIFGRFVCIYKNKIIDEIYCVLCRFLVHMKTWEMIVLQIGQKNFII